MKKLEPIRVPWKPVDGLIVFGLAWIGVPVVLIIFMRLASPLVPIFGTLLVSFRNGDIVASFVFAIVNAVAALGVIAFYLHRYHASWQDLGWRKFNFARTIMYLVIGFILFLVIIQLTFMALVWLVPSFNPAQPQTNDFTAPTTSLGRQLSLIALVLLPPVVEETVFRGFIFPAFSKWRGEVVGAIMTSILFGFAHLQYNVSIYTLILSLILCYMYWRLRSIWPGVALHMINNYIAYSAIIKK
ncbi:MAG: CPBP family intramembrane glutamic endopeptidase [Candidatus Saccharimonadia bacterium]